MKKILKLLFITTFTSPIALSVIACNSQPDWNNIPIPPPQIPIEVSGFEGIDFKTMKITDYDTVAKLFTAIDNKLQNSPWQKGSATTWSGTKDGKVINLKTDDLRRNGQYYFEIKSNIALPGIAKFIITITSSHHIADNVAVTNLGEVHGIEAKKILFAIVLKNMNLINLINEIAQEYLDTNNIKINADHTSATLTSPNEPNEYYFYGSLTLNFSVIKITPPAKPVAIEQAITKPSLGIIPDSRPYTILMYVIIRNFVTKPNSWPEIANDLEINNIKINDNENSATISAIKGSLYYSGSTQLQFKLEN